MNSLSATSPSIQVPMKKKARVDNAHTNCLRSSNIPLIERLHSTTLQSHNDPHVTTAKRFTDASQQLNTSNLPNEHMLGGHHSASAASSLRHSQAPQGCTPQQRRLNILGSAEPNRHGDSETPALSINGLPSGRYLLDSHDSLCPRSTSNSSGKHSTCNKNFVANPNITSSNAKSRIMHATTSLQDPGRCDFFMPSTSGSKQIGMEMARGEGVGHNHNGMTSQVSLCNTSKSPSPLLAGKTPSKEVIELSHKCRFIVVVTSTAKVELNYCSTCLLKFMSLAAFLFIGLEVR